MAVVERWSLVEVRPYAAVRNYCYFRVLNSEVPEVLPILLLQNEIKKKKVVLKPISLTSSYDIAWERGRGREAVGLRAWEGVISNHNPPIFSAHNISW